MKTKGVVFKGLSVFLSLIMIIGIMVTASFSAFAEEEIVVVYVDGIQVTESNSSDVLGDGKVSFDFEKNALTLKEASLKGGEVDGTIVGIYATGSIDIYLEGNNAMNILAEGTGNCGILVMGDVNFYGDDIIIRNGAFSLTEDVESDIQSVGVFSVGKITVSGASVQSQSGDIAGGSGINAVSMGVLSFGGIELKDEGYLAGVGGTITGTPRSAASIGVTVFGLDDSVKSVLVRDGGITGRGSDVNSTESSLSLGAYLEFCELGAFVTESYIDFEGGVALTDSEIDGSLARSNGAFISGGNFATDGGNIRFTAKECKGDVTDGDALVVKSDYVNNREFGGYVVIYCDEILLNTYGYGFQGTEVRLNSESGVAIVADKGIEISDKLTISLPEDAAIANVESGEFTVQDKEGTIVSKAEITPLIYKVKINDAERSLSVTVPANESINDIYCEMFDFDDFSDYLITEKEGFVFEGWYVDEEFTVEFGFDNAITSNITVYGKWTEVSNEQSSSDVFDDSSELSEDSSEFPEDSSELPEDSSEFPEEDAKPGDNGTAIFFIVSLVSLMASALIISFRRRAINK